MWSVLFSPSEDNTNTKYNGYKQYILRLIMATPSTATKELKIAELTRQL
jgi:hypothetical protein